MAKTARLHFMLHEDTVKQLKKAAQQKPWRGNMTRALEDILDFFFSLDPSFMVMLAKHADIYNRSIAEIIEAFVIRRIADEGAYIEHYGKASPRALAEFARRNGKYLRGDDLYEDLKEETKALLQAYDEAVQAGDISFVKGKEETILHEVLMQ